MSAKTQLTTLVDGIMRIFQQHYPMVEWVAPIAAVERLSRDLIAARASIRNIAGDTLCRFDTDAAKAEAKALPEAEFLESCRRFRQQVADERGEATGCRTIAQLEARIVGLERERERAVKSLVDLFPIAMDGVPKRGHDGSCGPESGCDGICAEVATASEALREAQATIRLLRGTATEEGAGR